MKAAAVSAAPVTVLRAHVQPFDTAADEARGARSDRRRPDRTPRGVVAWHAGFLCGSRQPESKTDRTKRLRGPCRRERLAGCVPRESLRPRPGRSHGSHGIGGLRAVSHLGRIGVRPPSTSAFDPRWPAVSSSSFTKSVDRVFLPIEPDTGIHETLCSPRLERAIRVIYRPETERGSHYFQARLADQFDAVIHLDETHALVPLDPVQPPSDGEPPETYPSRPSRSITADNAS